MPTVAEKEKVATTFDATTETRILDKVKILIAEELPSLIADALKHNHTAHHQPTTAVKPRIHTPESTAQPDTPTTSAKKSTLNWQTAGVIVLMVSAIIGGWWALENRFEKKLETAINGVETRLGGQIQEMRQEVRQEIAAVNTRIDALYQLLLEQRR